MWAVSCEIPPPNRRTAACRRSWGGAIHARRRTRCASVSAMIPDHHREFVARNRCCVLGWDWSEGATESRADRATQRAIRFIAR